MKLGKLKEVKLREIWKHEQYDFSNWLSKEENLNELGNTLGLTLVEVETEKLVGSYRCDILCKDEITSKVVLIENQLEPTNHDHLGKIITYASGLNASVIVWIVEHAREEHASAIEWLNKNMDSDISFFLMELHAYQIGDSLPAPYFKIIEQPNDFTQQIKSISKNEGMNESMSKRLEFWTMFNDVLTNRGLPFNKRKPTTDHWYDFAIGSSKCHLCCSLVNKSGFIRIEMWINDSKEQYDHFFSKKDEIENAIGHKLLWQRLDNKKASRISLNIEGLDFNDNGNYSQLMNDSIDMLILFRNAFKPYCL